MSITQPPLSPLTTSPSATTDINATTATTAGNATAARLSNIVTGHSTGHYSDHQQATESRPPNSTSTSTAAGSATATSAVSTEHHGGHLHPPTHQQHQSTDHQLPPPPPPPPTQPQPQSQPQQESSTISLPPFNVDAHPTVLAAAATAAAAHHHASANHDDHHALQSAVVVAPDAIGQAPPQPSIEPGNVANPQPYPPEPVASMYTQALPMASQTPSPASATTPKPQSKTTRLRRACDLCSSRKVKCDETHPCRPCRDLQVDCTFNREMRRRGPPNRHAEAARAAKRPRLEPALPNNMGHHAQPHNAAQTLISIAGNPRGGHHAEAHGQTQTMLDAESIAPWSVLVLLVDDFFTYIHPLTPFPHEPTFRQQLANREDQKSREFLALLASMVGCLVASFPRTARLHFKSQHGLDLFPKAIYLVDRCRQVAMEARGSHFYNREDMTVYDAVTSYLLGLAAAYTLQWKDQIGKRVFWVLFLGVRSMMQLGGPSGDVVFPPPTPAEPYPDFPVEVDDEFILPSQILVQPPSIVSRLTGFVQAIKIYMTMNPLVSIELSYGLSTLPFQDQKVMLQDCVQAVKQVMEGMPPELTLDLDSNPADGVPTSLSELSRIPASRSALSDSGFQYCAPAYPAHQPASDIRHIVNNDHGRRLLQYEIQKANIYASQVATRSYFVERYLNLRDAHREHTRNQAAQAYDAVTAVENGVNGSNGVSHDSNKSVAAAALHAAAEELSDPIDENMTAERELIVQNLLVVLASISQRNMEPNGASFINKVRQVASTLVHDAPGRKGPMATKAQEPLTRFLDILMRLEKTGPGNTDRGDGTMTPQDEEMELRSWADLREHQMRFYQSGGFMGQL
ncbi:uncharacterized protein B0T23DRAFT_324847 [Neurospora hispaniola]|uniref:Zn(2)-C6 fungal-type domain-containing protein n=1 Tax=Neurospora hispaniola TaxID=588809 RepID=A0AAJ0I0R1_9PEZI|nr:hypothetical protein B0T23DRAFT_324847 [Neurospora hispaniola]